MTELLLPVRSFRRIKNDIDMRLPVCIAGTMQLLFLIPHVTLPTIKLKESWFDYTP
jgi:hypothetical protein